MKEREQRMTRERGGCGESSSGGGRERCNQISESHNTPIIHDDDEQHPTNGVMREEVRWAGGVTREREGDDDELLLLMAVVTMNPTADAMENLTAW